MTFFALECPNSIRGGKSPREAERKVERKVLLTQGKLKVLRVRLYEFSVEKVNKHSGNIKRVCKKEYQQILASNPEILCPNFNESMPDTTEAENIIPPITQDKPNNNSISMVVQNLESEDTSFDNVIDGKTSSDDNEKNTKLLSVVLSLVSQIILRLPFEMMQTLVFLSYMVWTSS
ncbi:hypothetical protein JTB14_011911 [Gonioctena quinquepunctata]|nr:hypothetical protein JTB14_011911 [Gonioctena quinquepunctata]